jgi:hypothetical protein
MGLLLLLLYMIFLRVEVSPIRMCFGHWSIESHTLAL